MLFVIFVMQSIILMSKHQEAQQHGMFFEQYCKRGTVQFPMLLALLELLQLLIKFQNIIP